MKLNAVQVISAQHEDEPKHTWRAGIQIRDNEIERRTFNQLEHCAVIIIKSLKIQWNGHMKKEKFSPLDQFLLLPYLSLFTKLVGIYIIE